MSIELIKPSLPIFDNPEALLKLHQRLYDAVLKLMSAAEGVTPENVAQNLGTSTPAKTAPAIPAVGAVTVAKLAGVTVTDPKTGANFVADLYAYVVRP